MEYWSTGGIERADCTPQRISQSLGLVLVSSMASYIYYAAYHDSMGATHAACSECLRLALGSAALRLEGREASLQSALRLDGGGQLPLHRLVPSAHPAVRRSS